MCQVKSILAFKNREVVAPAYNDSHSALLNKLGVEDNRLNALKMFVRMELVPPNKDLTADIKDWKYRVDQDIVPDWYESDPGKYEERVREAVADWMEKHTVTMLGKSWSPIKTDERGTYYLLNEIYDVSVFGQNNNYAESGIRADLQTCKLAKQAKEEFGDRLVSITTDLTSLDGLKDYGKAEGDILAIPTVDLYRECRENIINLGEMFWLSTPDSTPSGCGSGYVQCVCDFGCVDYYGCEWNGGVRPYLILKS